MDKSDPGGDKTAGFTDNDLRLLVLIASQIAKAIQLSRERSARSKQERLASIGQMLAGVLHDLKTPMTIISGYAQLMAQIEDAAQREAYVSQILRQFDLMSGMTREVLAFARGETEVLIRRVYMNRFLDDLVTQLNHALAGRNITLQVDAQYQGKAYFDEQKIMRVFHNLARNAADAMPQGGELTITASESSAGDRGELVFDIIDNGPGIPAELEGRLFEMFASAKQGGTGLGLAIVKKIVEEHQGRIEYQSRPGEGTQFTVCLPLDRPDSSSGPRLRRRYESLSAGEWLLTQPAIELLDIHKRFGRTIALGGVSLVARRGEVLGFVGQNGAGKSTALRIASGFLDPDRGSARIMGRDVRTERSRARQAIGYLPESAPLYRDMRVSEFLRFRARLKGVVRGAVNRRIAEVCDRLGLADHQRAVIGTLSRGYRQRVGLADALIGEPPILLLDEPTSGLDPMQRRELRTLLADLAGQHTIVLSSHALTEIETLASRVVVPGPGPRYCARHSERASRSLRSGARGIPRRRLSGPRRLGIGLGIGFGFGFGFGFGIGFGIGIGTRRMRALVTIGVVARRELAAYFHAPIAYVVGVAFLILQGFSFYAVVEVLADPGRPAPVGAVLSTYFGGTFLWWTVVLVAIAALSMRLVAEDRRQGMWEALLTAPVDESSVIVGKWLGSLAFYVLLWLPTLAYPLILRAYAPPESQLDLGPLAASYLGVVFIGAAFLAVGIAASAATRNQIVAAVAAFAGSVIILLLGQLADIAPRWAEGSPLVAAVLDHIDIRGHMGDLARGEITAAALVFLASLTAVGLLAATLAALLPRRRRTEIAARFLALGLVAIIATCVNIAAARHGPGWDVSRSRLNTLDPRTREILASIEPPGLDIIVIRAGLDAFAGVQVQIDRLLHRMVASRPLISVETIDPTHEPGRVEALAAEFAQAAENVRDGGMVLVAQNNRRRAVDILDMAGFDEEDLSAGTLSFLRAEEAVASAILEVIDPDRPTFCYTVGHGEIPLKAAETGDASAADQPTWAGLVSRVERDGGRFEALDRFGAGEQVGDGVPRHCRVLILAGPRRDFTAAEAAAVGDFLARGGRLFVATAEAPLGTAGPQRSNLAVVLAEYGIGFPAAIAVDPDNAVDNPTQWLVTSGYGDHPITASFRDRRLTMWLAPRAVTVVGSASLDHSVLVQTSPAGFGESDLAAVRTGRSRRDARDLPGPVPVAVAVESPSRGTRIVALGGAFSLTTEVTARAPANDILAVSALSWLSGQTRSAGVAARRPESVRLIMTGRQKSMILLLAAGVLPSLLALLGGLVWWRRRRA